MDFVTNTPKILSKNIKINPRVIPNARFSPIPPLLLKEATETPIIVRINAESGKLHLLCLTSKWVLINVEPLLISESIKSFKSLKFKVSAL